MDWRSSATGDIYRPYMNPDEEMQEEDNEDFYGSGIATNGEDTQPGALDREYHVGPHRCLSCEDELTGRYAGCE